MSYPKKHPAAQSQVGTASQYGGGQQKSIMGNSVGLQKDDKFVKRREQLQQLLVNKFRGKYLSGRASIEEENNVDRVIRAEVMKFLESEQMTEANLIKLDTRLSEILQTRNSAYGAVLVGRGSNSRGSQFMGDSGRLSPEQDYYATADSRGSKRGLPPGLSTTQALKPLSQASQRSRSSAIKDVGNQILQSPTAGAHNTPQKDGDYWTKIIMHNVEQFQREKDAVKAKIRENQMKMREDLKKQMEDHKLAK